MISGSAQPAGPPLNATAAALLGLLLDGPMTGRDLMSAAEERIGQFWTLTRSQVYRELAATAERGLLSADPTGPVAVGHTGLQLAKRRLVLPAAA